MKNYFLAYYYFHIQLYIIESFHLHTINQLCFNIFFNLSWFFEKINTISKCLARQKENATLVSVT